VKESKDQLLKKLWSVEETGVTALGPAMLLGITIAGSQPRSKVILCTDGLANRGIGDLDGKQADYTPFYTELAEQAKLKGVTVSVMTLIGTDCNMENLGVVAEQTGGDIERVDPLNMTANLSSIVSTRVLAYGTMAMVILHRGLQFKGEMDDEKENRNWVVKDLGNVTAESECTFSYAFRPKSECDLTGVKQIPFQVQLLYTRPNGMQCLRVATTCIQLTDNQDEAELNADVNVVMTHAATRAAKMAKAGHYEEAQLETRAAHRFMLRNNVESETVTNWTDQAEVMDKVLRGERDREKQQPDGGKQDMKSRQRNRNDEATTVIAKQSKVKAVNFSNKLS